MSFSPRCPWVFVLVLFAGQLSAGLDESMSALDDNGMECSTGSVVGNAMPAVPANPRVSTEPTPPLSAEDLSRGGSAHIAHGTNEALKRLKATNETNYPAMAMALEKLAEAYHSQGEYAEAEPLYVRALTIKEKMLGLEHLDLVETLNKLAEFYEAQEQYSNSEPLRTRALAIMEKVLGPEHLDVAEALNEIAGLYAGTCYSNRYGYSLPLYMRALAIKEKVLGPEHLDVAEALNEIASGYEEQEQYTNSLPLRIRILAIREKALGPEHSDVADALYGLALCYEGLDRQEEAESLRARALRIEEKTLRQTLQDKEKAIGPEHPDVAKVLNKLADCYAKQQQYSNSATLRTRALRIEEKTLGPEHPDVAKVLNKLADCYAKQQQYSNSAPLRTRALRIEEKTLCQTLQDKEKVLGCEHPGLLKTLDHLAYWYVERERYSDAELLYTRALAIQEKTLQQTLADKEKALGREHPDLVQPLTALARCYQIQLKYSNAEHLLARAQALQEKTLQQTLADEEKTLRCEHPNLLEPLTALADFYKEQNRDDQAEILRTRARAIQEKTLQQTLADKEKLLGIEHPDLVEPLTALASFYLDHGHYSDAEPLRNRVWTIQEKTLQHKLADKEKAVGHKHLDLVEPLERLAQFYDWHFRPTEAQPLHARTWAIQEKTLQQKLKDKGKALDDAHPDLVEPLDQLAQFYESRRRYNDAEPLRTRVLAIQEKRNCLVPNGLASTA